MLYVSSYKFRYHRNNDNMLTTDIPTLLARNYTFWAASIHALYYVTYDRYFSSVHVFELV
jgi:hypothetical protein